MYKIGDYVVKNGKGVCKVENIMHLNMSGVDKNRLYYLLVPLNDENGKVYLPVDSSVQQVRKVMSEVQALELIAKTPQMQELDIVNDKLREQKYKETMKGNDPEALLRIIKTAYLRKKHRQEKGMKSTVTDDYYLNLAEQNLFSELCLVLHKNNKEVHKLIVEEINKQ